MSQTETPTRITTLRTIVANHQADTIDGHLVDATTANLLVTLHDALAPASQAKFDDITLPRLVDFAWKRAA